MGICFVIMFSQSVACIFIFLRVLFKTQKLLILIKYSLSFSVFMDHDFHVVSKKVFPKVQVQYFLLKVLCIAFLSITYL